MARYHASVKQSASGAQMVTFYLHVRSRADASAYATIGPYSSREDAERAARFARLVHYTVVVSDAAALKLF